MNTPAENKAFDRAVLCLVTALCLIGLAVLVLARPADANDTVQAGHVTVEVYRIATESFDDPRRDNGPATAPRYRATDWNVDPWLWADQREDKRVHRYVRTFELPNRTDRTVLDHTRHKTMRFKNTALGLPIRTRVTLGRVDDHYRVRAKYTTRTMRTVSYRPTRSGERSSFNTESLTVDLERELHDGQAVMATRPYDNRRLTDVLLIRLNVQ